jgi:hypothetical protein
MIAPALAGAFFHSITSSARVSSASGTVKECGLLDAGSVQLDACELDHFAPLLGFVSDELVEVRRRTGEHRGAQDCKPCLQLGLAETRIDLFVELVDDFDGRVLRRAD